MAEYTTNVGVTHIWPYSREINSDAQPFSEERESDIWDELRDLTLDDEVRGKIAVALHETLNHNATANTFNHELQRDDVGANRVTFYRPREVEFHIQRAATPARSYRPLRSVDEEFKLNESGEFEEVPDTSDPIVIPAKPARDEKDKHTIAFHLGSKPDAEFVIKQHRNHEICALVLWYPDESEHLKCLPMVRKQRPDLPVYIFHCDYRADKWGVEREGHTTGSLWDTQSAFDKEADLPWVIEGIAHAGESTWFGALPKQMKTWVLLCVVKALLTGEPLFNDSRYKANKARKVIYLIPEASRASVKKRLKLLGLMGFLYDPITNPNGVLFVRTLSAGEKIKLTDPRLLEIVKDADVFLDTAIRWLEGEENKSSDVAVLSENIFSLIAAGARSIWCAHHAPKGFADASTMTLENMFRGSGEYGAALSNAYGLCQTDEKTSTLHFHAIVGRDLDELIPDMILQGRPYLSETGNFKVVNANAEPFKGRNNQSGPKDDPDKQAKIDFAKSIEGSNQEKADAVNEKFGSEHPKETIRKWLKPFKGEASNK
jgi:AAA domain